MDPHNIPDTSLFRQATPVQIRFNDVDVLGHVNNSIYFTYFDTGKAAFFEAVLSEPVSWRHVETVIANIDCAFLAPVFYGDDIEVLTACKSVSERSFRLLQVLRDRKGEIKAMCETVMVAFNPDTMQPQEVPARWREGLSNFMYNPA